jgi:L-iditol 2-dehydrogenase
MRVAELFEPRRFRIVDADVPDPGPGEVQVEVRAVGICGSDSHNFNEGSVGDTPSVYPMVLGHEPAGTVCKLGPGVGGWSAGDRAALEPAIYCYHCEYCRAGRHNLCARIRFLSTPPDPGFFRQRLNLPVRNLLPLPPEISLDYATLFEPLAVVLHSMKFAALQPAETAVVFGAGPVGLMTVALLKLCGAGRVWAVEPVPARREMARAIGADAGLDPAAANAAHAILADTAHRGVDLVVDCATRGDSIDNALGAVRNGGRMVMTGIPVEVHTPWQSHLARRKELAVFNVRRSNHESLTALDLLRRRPDLFSPIITHTMPLERVQAAFEMLAEYSDGVGKVVLRP